MLQPNERIDQLYADDIKIIQSSEVFSFSLDAVLLANYARVPKRGVIVDLCAGNGAVGLFISKKTTAHIYQIELQERLADMAQRSIELNDLQDQLTVYPMDLKNLFQKSNLIPSIFWSAIRLILKMYRRRSKTRTPI